MIARGLPTGWKTPVYFGFDEPMTKDILPKIIVRVEDEGFHVRSITFDLGIEVRRNMKRHRCRVVPDTEFAR